MDSSTRRAIAEQREYYEHRAAGFDSSHLGSRLNRCHRAKIERIHRLLRLDQCGSARPQVLEVGTGTGIHAAWLLEMNSEPSLRYVGIDVSAGMVTAARDRLATARDRLAEPAALAQSAAEALPFADASFDGVYCSGTLHHVADKALAIREMRRVVRPGSRIVLSEPNPWNPVNAWAWASNRAERGQLDIRIGRLSKWLESAGFRVDEVELFNFTPPSPRAFARLFDRIDRLASKLPLVRRIASMVLVAGTAR